MPSHIVLLGDSIFDNSSYTAGEPDVVTHLGERLPAPWGATLCAIDGAVAADIPEQVANVPEEASHLVLSVGGNDALHNRDILSTRVSSTAEALALVGERLGHFEASYRAAVAAVLDLGLDTTVCTIYNGDLDPDEAPLARIALMSFNDVVLRVAIEHRLRVIDLRFVCTKPEDYANPIEPSGVGGQKIAAAIARAIAADEKPAHARVFTA